MSDSMFLHKIPETTQINFNNCLFNENILPAYTNGNFTTNNLADLSISPGTGKMAAGETQQFTVNGDGIPPYTLECK